MQPLALLEEQLWAPALTDGRARVIVDPAPDPEWVDAETYRALPRAARARMLLPDGPRAAAVGSLLNYRGLRRRRENLVRAGLGAVVRSGVPLPLPRVVVQVRHHGPVPDLPLAVLARALGRDRLFASIGVRTGANRKATLQLVDERGAPAGYAKFGWNDIADEYVATEARTLSELPRAGAGGMRAPRSLATLDFHGHPVVVTEPLPADVRGAYGDPTLPSPDELYSLCPVRRTAPVRETGHYRALVDRLGALEPAVMPGDLDRAVTGLVARVDQVSETVAVAERWHGDLTAWNCARDASGRLWAWDWESSEVDAAAGLDALHWDFSDRRLAARSLDALRLADSIGAAAPHLVAAGTARSAHPAVAAVYVLTVVERAATLAARNGGWAKVWISPSTLAGLAGQAAHLIG